MCQAQYQLYVHYQLHLGFQLMRRVDNKNKVKTGMGNNCCKTETNENLCEHAAMATYWFIVLLDT